MKSYITYEGPAGNEHNIEIWSCSVEQSQEGTGETVRLGVALTNVWATGQEATATLFTPTETIIFKGRVNPCQDHHVVTMHNPRKITSLELVERA